MYKTKLTAQTKQLIAYNTVKSSLDSFAKRADRKLKPLANEVYQGVEKGLKLTKDIGIIADIRFEEKDKARTLKEGINEFKKRFPDYGKELQNIINETRTTKKRYLVFGVESGFEIPEENYIQALRDIGVRKGVLKSTYKAVVNFADELAQKKTEGLEQILIK